MQGIKSRYLKIFTVKRAGYILIKISHKNISIQFHLPIKITIGIINSSHVRTHNAPTRTSSLRRLSCNLRRNAFQHIRKAHIIRVVRSPEYGQLCLFRKFINQSIRFIFFLSSASGKSRTEHSPLLISFYLQIDNILSVSIIDSGQLFHVRLFLDNL